MASKADIRTLVDSFVADLERLIKDSIREGFAAAIGDSPQAARPTKAKAAAPAAKPAGGAGGRKRKKGEKRPPAELKRVEESLHAFITKSPGLRIEQINKALGTQTSELSRPLSKLIAKKKVRRQGEKRASRYFPGPVK